MLTVLCAFTVACAWLARNAIPVTWAALAVLVTVLVARALPRPDLGSPEPDPDPADFAAHPDAEELGRLFAAAVADHHKAPSS